MGATIVWCMRKIMLCRNVDLRTVDRPFSPLHAAKLLDVAAAARHAGFACMINDRQEPPRA